MNLKYKTSLLIYFVFVTLLKTFAQEKPKTLVDFNLIGKVKDVTYSYFFLNEINDSTIQESSDLRSDLIFLQFSKSGNLLIEKEGNSLMDISKVTQCVENKKGEIIELKQFKEFSNSDLVLFQKYIYDSRGRLIEMNVQNENGYNETEKYQYIKGNIINKKVYESDTLLSNFEIDYNDKGDWIKKEEFNIDGDLVDSKKREYDKNYNLVKEETYIEDDLIFRLKQVFDKDNNLLEKKIYTVQDVKLELTSQSFFVYSKNIKVKYEIENSDTTSTSIYQYLNDKLIQKDKFKNGNKINSRCYEFADNDLIKSEVERFGDSYYHEMNYFEEGDTSKNIESIYQGHRKGITKEVILYKYDNLQNWISKIKYTFTNDEKYIQKEQREITYY